ncbi:hypothetical protein SEPCBS119000_004650 [Sporothrix epigloea]|uniref:Xylanolytic transcriptional activator regulatory domain-containing protein n=1 Tax=Sporothrix epigloea TaxID=1892477 RepID=A0ABP0DTA7_9PEZI
MASAMGGGQHGPRPDNSPGGVGTQQLPPVLGAAGGYSRSPPVIRTGLDREDPTVSLSTGQSPLGSSPVNPGNNTAQRVIKRRSAVACRSVFPTRGAPDMDREYRHPRMKGAKARKMNAEGNQHRQSLLGAPLSAAGGATGSVSSDPWDMLPPLEQVIDAVKTFTRQYFQLGFIPRHNFIIQLREQPRSISLFLLLSLLSVSGRMTPSLVEAYGGPDATAELFMDRASTVALGELYQEPTLSRCQAFYLLSLAQQGSGYRNRSYVNLGIALRMAILMKLHREETYRVDEQESTPAMIQHSESARRTLWMLYSQDNLHADPLAPTSLSESDITTLLPSSEEDFESGTCPTIRAALENVTPTRSKPALANAPKQSLFASLMQSHRLWGRVLRRTINKNSGKQPWDRHSEYAAIKKKLYDWENSLPTEHLWSPALLREHKAKGVDLAYVAVTMVTRLCHILIRKAYIPFMLTEGGPKQHEGFWRTMASELVFNIKDLFAQIECWVQEQAPGDGTGAQLALCFHGSISVQIPQMCVALGFMEQQSSHRSDPNTVCPDASTSLDAERMLDRTMDVLKRSTDVWPLARRWIDSIEKFVAAEATNLVIIQCNSHESGMAEGRDPIPSALHPPLAQTAPSGPSNNPFDDRRQLARQLGPDKPSARSLGTASGGAVYNQTPVRLPQLRTDTFNSHMRLPPPQLPSNFISTMTGSANHYASPSTSMPVPPHGIQNGKGNVTVAQNQQLGQQPLLRQDILSMAHDEDDVAGVGPSIAHLLPPVQLGASSPGPQLPPVPPSIPLENLVAGSNPRMTTVEPEAAVVLSGGVAHHGALGYGDNQSQEQQQQGHENADGMHVDPLDGNSMSLMDTATAYDPENLAHFLVPDDGYQNELQAWAQGPGLQAGASWASSVFGF